jgi:hypothetical protein
LKVLEQSFVSITFQVVVPKAAPDKLVKSAPKVFEAAEEAGKKDDDEMVSRRLRVNVWVDTTSSICGQKKNILH